MISQRLSLPLLAGTFLRIGALAFGGLGPTLSLIERELVDGRHAVTRQDIAEALTHTKLLPGSTVVQVVAYLGWRLGGWPGSAVATIGFIFPSALLMLGLAYGYAQIVATPAALAARRGMLAVVIALLIATLARLSAQVLTTPYARVLAVGAFAIVVMLPSSSPWIVLSAGLIGLVVSRGPR